MKKLLTLWIFILLVAWPSECQRFLRRNHRDLQSHTLRRDGEVNIGVLVDLHHQSPDGSSGYCGVINVDSVQQVLAAHWAVEVINNQSSPHDVDIGIQFHDTCSFDDLMEKHLYHVITSSHLGIQSQEEPPLLGIIGIGDSQTMIETGGALGAFNVPLVTVGNENPRRNIVEIQQKRKRVNNVLTTAPDAAGQSLALANVAYNLDISSVTLISSNPRAVKTFLKEAKRLGITVENLYEFSSTEFSSTKIAEFLSGIVLTNDTASVVLIADSNEALGIAENLRHSDIILGRIRWLVGSVGLDLKHITSWKDVFDGGIFIEPHLPELAEFKDYFIKSLQDQDHRLSDILKEYKEELFSCEASNSQSSLMSCDSITPQDINLHFQQDPRVSFVVKAVSAFTAALKLSILNRCSSAFSDARQECLKEVLSTPDLHEEILNNLKKLSFTAKRVDHGNRDSGMEHYFSSNGYLVASKQLIFAMNKRKKSMIPIGWYAESEGLHIDPEYVSPKVLERYNGQNARSPYARAITDVEGSIDEERFVSIRNTNFDNSKSSSKGAFHRSSSIMLSYETFVGRTWALVVISVASLGTCVALWMLAYVLIKICDGTLNGNQTMGILLLLSVAGLFTSVIPWLLPPNEVTCVCRHFLHPIFSVTCFGILLVKSMQLRSLISVGLGGTIPQINQILSLIFMIVVQIVIAVEWYISLENPMDVILDDGYPICSNVSKERFLLLHLYPSILLLLAFFYGVSVIKIKHNYNEGRWITCATVFIIPVFAAWSIVYYFAPVEFRDPSVAVSITTVAGILLISIFVPKMNTINKRSNAFRKLKRTNSDSTIYTGFSAEYVRQDPRKMQYPHLGNGGGSPGARPLHHRHSRSHYYHHHHHHHGSHRHHHHSHHRRDYPYPSNKIHFNGLNYMSGSSSSYSDWKKHHHYHRHHSRDTNHRDLLIHEDPPLIRELTPSEEEEDGESQTIGNDVTIIEGEPSRISDISGSSKKYGTKGSNEIYLETTAKKSSFTHHSSGRKSPLYRTRHDHHRSHSPTDGMILTPTGLYHY